MFSSISSNLSALNAFDKKMGVTSNNIANSGTEGFKKSRAVMKEGENSGVKVEINRVDTPGPLVNEVVDGKETEKELSNVDLTEEIPQTISTQRNFEANIKAIQTQEEMLGTILDIID